MLRLLSRYVHLSLLPSYGHDTNTKQGIVKGFTDTGFKAQSQPLSAFQESYGLEGDEDEETEDAEEGQGDDEEDSEEDSE